MRATALSRSCWRKLVIGRLLLDLHPSLNLRRHRLHNEAWRRALQRRAAILTGASVGGGSVATQRRRPRTCSSPACYLHEFGPAHKITHRGDIRVKRIYDEPDAADGFRALVDRLWPRGISKQRAALDDWLVDLAPSTALRKWLHHDPTRWLEFARRYRAELRAQAAALQALRQRATQQRVTLLYAAHDARRNHAVVLRDVLRK